MSFPFVNKTLTTPQKAVQKSTPALPMVTPNPMTAGQKQQNPFMIAMKTDSAEFRETYGVNKPLEKPMFLGYRENKALYGGSRLFILY